MRWYAKLTKLTPAGATDFHLRAALPDDEVAVTDLLTASYSALLADHYDLGLLAKLLPYIGRANPGLLASGRYFVVVGGKGDFLGCGGWSREVPGSQEVRAGEAHIRHFATHPAAVRKGVGGALLTRCIADARAEGNRMLYADAALNAEHFYAAFGFRSLRRIDGDMPDGLKMPAIMMRLDLV
jgi:N-acetylglutamate synthase-like GNAT family acetyltransferase